MTAWEWWTTETDFTITLLARFDMQRLTRTRLKVLERRHSFSRIAVITIKLQTMLTIDSIMSITTVDPP